MNIIAPDFSRKATPLDFSALNPRHGHGMERLFISGMQGGKPLMGSVNGMGSKNASLPEMVASILTADDITLTNLPALADLETMAQMLSMMGVSIATDNFHKKTLTLNAGDISKPFAPYDVVRKMRASIFVLGPLLARMGRASVSLPGGCAIGARPVDLHIKSLEKMGATIEVVDGYVVANADNGLQGAEIDFPFVSVGATENIMMAASLANGTTILRNAAREPEIIDLGKLLTAMGAKISGLGTATITIDGVKKLHGTSHAVISDRIEVGSILCAVAGVGGQVTIDNIVPDHLTALSDVLTTIGAVMAVDNNSITITMNGRAQPIEFLKTAPYPDFPTDLQAQVMAVLSTAAGQSKMEEAIFENRYMHVPELNRLGAKISLQDNIATIDGVDQLRAAPVMATDLRASMSLVIAGMKAEGDTVINRIYHLDRGYDDLEKKLSHLGATIARKP